MYGDAIKTFDELAASETGVVRLRALRKAMDAAFLKGDEPDLLMEYTSKAEEVAVDNRLEEARVINSRARAWGFAGGGDLKMDLADYDVVLQIFEEENSIADTADALWRSGLYSVFFEDSQERGLGKLLRSVAIFRELGDVRKEIEATLNTGLAFLFFTGLLPEARREYANVLRIGEKLDVFAELAQASALYFDGERYFDQRGEKLAEPVSQALKGLEYCKKTDVDWIQGTLYATLTRLYSKLGDLKHADEYFDRMTKLSPEILSHFLNITAIAVCKGVYFAAKAQWEESNQCFEELLEYSNTYPGQEITGRANYAWALEKQGRAEEARVQRARVQKVSERVQEKFGHANVQLSLMVPRKVQVGEEFEMRLDLINVGRKPGLLVKIEGVTLLEFKFPHLPSFCNLQEGSLAIKEKSVGPFQVETVKLKLKATKAGSYNLTPEVVYVDDLGKTKTFKANLITVTAQPAQPAFEALPGRITTGYPELDRLLLGGIPEKYAVVLAAPSCDERQLLIKLFLEAGAKAGKTTLYITCEAGSIKDLAEQFQLNFSLLVCNLQADLVVENLPNVYKLKGTDNLTDIDIALTKFFRTLYSSQTIPKRACIDLLSDVLLQHHAVTTRKWLSSLLTNLKSKGFTTLAVIDPRMHPSEEVQAILGLFDGEITIAQKESNKGLKKVLKILKLYNQEYLEDELTLTREGLNSKS